MEEGSRFGATHPQPASPTGSEDHAGQEEGQEAPCRNGSEKRPRTVWDVIHGIPVQRSLETDVVAPGAAGRASGGFLGLTSPDGAEEAVVERGSDQVRVGAAGRDES